MTEQMIITGVLIDENMTVSFVEACQKYNLSEELLMEMIEHGLVKPHTEKTKYLSFDQKTIGRIQSARRLQEDLAINLAGVVLVLELLDELEHMRSDLSILQRHVDIEL